MFVDTVQKHTSYRQSLQLN